MKSFLLLILSLMAGCEASSKVKGCAEGWAELTCKYPKKTSKNDQNIEVVNHKETTIQSTKKDVWEEKGRFSLYHDTKNKNLRMVIKQLKSEDFGKYKCKFDQDKSSEESKEVELELKTVKDGCQTPFTQTAYETAKTTITCDYPKKDKSSVKFICKDNKLTCEEILSTQSSVKSNGTFTLTDTNSGFNMSISSLSSQHAGVYWCGVKSKEGSYRTSLRKIQLEIKNITSFKRSTTIGQDFTYWCDYPQGTPDNKFICKGEDRSVCQPLWSTSKLRTNTGKFSMEDDKERRNITITVRNITTDDTGTYWCGAENTDNRRSKTFFHKLEMTVDINIFKRSPTVGQDFTYWCNYTQGAPIKKFICKGEDPSVCQPLWSTSKLRTNTGKFSMKDDKERRNITITVRNITTDDAGTYWCGAENTDNRRSKTFFNKLEMTVVPPAKRKGLLIAIITVICVAVLMVVLILVLAFKRCACSKDKTNEEGQNIAEDFVYEEIEDPPHKPNSGTALKTIYATANLPTNPSAFTHYSNVKRPNGSREVNGDTYSTVKDNGQYSTVNHPSGLSENPLYSTVNKPQEH